ncbi:MAG: hypothetical protein U0231_14535 [Nitrospiraceae bacterium]
MVSNVKWAESVGRGDRVQLIAQHALRSESVRWADELIVVDSHSTDATATISREFTEKVLPTRPTGLGGCGNEAIAHATHAF